MSMFNNDEIIGGHGVMGGMGATPTPGIANANTNVANTGAMSNQSAITGGTGGAMNTSTIGPIQPIKPKSTHSSHGYLSSFADLVSELFGGGKGKGKSTPKASVPAAGGTPPPAGPTAAGTGTTTGGQPIIDPLALHLFFSQIIGPYLDKIVGDQNSAADQLGAQMQHALSDFSLPPQARALLEARIPEEQADIRNVAETQRAAVASAPDLAAFMTTIQNAAKEQEAARLEQARVLAANATGGSTGSPDLQALIQSLTS